MGSLLTALRNVVRKRCTSTWSLSATSIPANPQPPVSWHGASSQTSNIFLHIHTGHLIYKCGGIDKRTIEKFEKVRLPHLFIPSSFHFALSQKLPLGGAVSLPINLRPTILAQQHQYTSSQCPWLTPRTGSRWVGQGFLQVCVGSWQAKGRAWAWYHHWYRSLEVRDTQVRCIFHINTRKRKRLRPLPTTTNF